MGTRAQPAAALRARRTRVRARRRDLGPDALAPRAGLPPGRPRRPARLLGPGRDRARRACSTSSRCGSPRDRATRVVIGSGPERARRRDQARRGRAARCSCSRPPTRPAARCAPRSSRCPGFRHDTFSSVYPAAAASPVFARMPLERHGLRWVHPRGVLRAPAARRRRARCCTATSTRPRRASTRCTPATASAGGRSPRRSLDAVRRACARRCCPASRRSRGPLQLLARRRAARRCDVRAAAAGMPAAALGRAAVPRRRRARLAVRRGDARRRAADARRAARSPPSYLNLLGHAVGWPSPRGRRGARSRTRSSAYLRELGGEVRTGARVDADRDRRRPRDRRRDSPAASALDAPLVDRRRRCRARSLRMAGDALPGWYRAALRRYRYGPGDAQGRLGARRPDPVGAPEARGAGTVHVGGGEDELARGHRAAPRGLPERPFLLLGQQSVADPTRAPGGQAHRLGLHARPAARRRLGGRARPPRRAHGGAGRALRARASATASSPATSSAPPTSRRRNANLVGGDVGGGSYALDQVVFRPLPSLSPVPHAAARACTSAARRRSRAARSTACRATRRRARRWPRRACAASDRRRRRSRLPDPGDRRTVERPCEPTCWWSPTRPPTPPSSWPSSARRARRGPLAVTLVVPTTWDGRVAARRRADAAAAALRDAGLDVDAVLGDADPVLAVQERWDPRALRRGPRGHAPLGELEVAALRPPPARRAPDRRDRHPPRGDAGRAGAAGRAAAGAPPRAAAARRARADARRHAAPRRPPLAAPPARDGRDRGAPPASRSARRVCRRPASRRASAVRSARPVADEHARALGARDGGVDEVAREHHVVAAGERHDDRRRLGALRLVDRDGVGEAQRPGLGDRDPQRPAVVGGEDARASRSSSWWTSTPSSPFISSRSWSLRVCTTRSPTPEARVPAIALAVGVQAARAAPSLSASMPTGPRCIGASTWTSARGSSP